MIPRERLSAIAITSALTPPDDQVTSALQDFERGGVAVGDASQGLTVINWRAYLAPNGVDVMLQAGTSAPFVEFTQAGIEELSFTFDQNMRPCFVYRTVGGTYLRWYDSFISTYTTTFFGNDIRNPKVTLDDKRSTQTASSDIIFAYIRGGSLCYRQQRDRFTIERTLRTGIASTVILRTFGMGTNLRLHFELV